MTENVSRLSGFTGEEKLGLVESLICQAHGINSANLRSRRITKRNVEARRDFSALAREMGFTYPQIAKFLGKDHTTIIHQVKRSRSPEFTRRVSQNDVNVLASEISLKSSPATHVFEHKE